MWDFSECVIVIVTRTCRCRLQTTALHWQIDDDDDADGHGSQSSMSTYNNRTVAPNTARISLSRDLGLPWLMAKLPNKMVGVADRQTLVLHFGRQRVHAGASRLF